MAKRETREQAIERREREEAMAFKLVWERERSKLVVADDRELFSEAVEQRLGHDQANALYCVLSEVRRLTSDYVTKLGWLKDSVAEAERNLAENRFYSSTPFQNVDDLHVTFGRMLATRESAAQLCRALGVYCPLLDDTRGRKLREKLVGLQVVPDGDGWVIEGLGHDGASQDGVTPVRPRYAEEWLAWRAARALVHGR